MKLTKKYLNKFIETELEQFKRDFYVNPVPEIQDTRGLAIAWLCYYFKTQISDNNTQEIVRFSDDVLVRPNYHTHGWFRISPILAAAYILSSDAHYADSFLRHIDCHQGWARVYIIFSAALISPLLQFNDPILKGRTENNIRLHNGFYQENIILYLCTRGAKEEKINWLEELQSVHDVDFHTNLLTALKKDGKISTPKVFISMSGKIKSYIIFRLFSQNFFSKKQAALFDLETINFNAVWISEKKNPLSAQSVDLAGSKIKN